MFRNEAQINTGWHVLRMEYDRFYKAVFCSAMAKGIFLGRTNCVGFRPPLQRHNTGLVASADGAGT